MPRPHPLSTKWVGSGHETRSLQISLVPSRPRVRAREGPSRDRARGWLGTRLFTDELAELINSNYFGIRPREGWGLTFFNGTLGVKDLWMDGARDGGLSFVSCERN